MAKRETLDPPRYKHFTVDPTRELPDELAPSAAFNEAEGEQVRALNEAAREGFLEAEKAREKEQQDDDGSRPKPTELLAQREGRGKDKDKDKAEDKKS